MMLTAIDESSQMMMIHLIIGWFRGEEASHNSGRHRSEGFNQEMPPQREEKATQAANQGYSSKQH